MGNDKNGNYFQVYDNASGDVQDGTNSSNKLYHDEKKNIVKGRTNTSYSQRVNPYKLSQVRKNKVKVQPKPNQKENEKTLFFIILLISTMNVFGQDKNIYNDGVIYNETGIAMNFLGCTYESIGRTTFDQNKKKETIQQVKRIFRIYSDNFDLFSV